MTNVEAPFGNAYDVEADRDSNIHDFISYIKGRIDFKSAYSTLRERSTPMSCLLAGQIAIDEVYSSERLAEASWNFDLAEVSLEAATESALNYHRTGTVLGLIRTQGIHLSLHKAIAIDGSMPSTSLISKAYSQTTQLLHELGQLEPDQIDETSTFNGMLSELVILALGHQLSLRQSESDQQLAFVPSLARQDHASARRKRSLSHAWDVSAFSPGAKELEVAHKIQVKSWAGASRYAPAGYAKDISVVQIYPDLAVDPDEFVINTITKEVQELEQQPESIWIQNIEVRLAKFAKILGIKPLAHVARAFAKAS